MNHKTTAENIISSRPDVNAEFSNATTQLSAWNVLSMTTLFQVYIVISTNAKIKPKVDLVENNSKTTNRSNCNSGGSGSDTCNSGTHRRSVGASNISCRNIICCQETMPNVFRTLNFIF